MGHGIPIHAVGAVVVILGAADLVIIAVTAAVITPSQDPISMLALAT